MGFPRRAAPALFAAAVALAAAVAVAADGHHEPLPVEESSVNHASISLDVGEIEAALGEVPPNYALAIDIYTNGKNSPKGTGLRTLKVRRRAPRTRRCRRAAGSPLSPPPPR